MNIIKIKCIEIKAHLERMIKGPYHAALEISGFTGAHVHIISGKQEYKLLKAEKEVKEKPGMLAYLSKSPIRLKDKYDRE